jgi:hypothetical protein
MVEMYVAVKDNISIMLSTARLPKFWKKPKWS